MWTPLQKICNLFYVSLLIFAVSCQNNETPKKTDVENSDDSLTVEFPVKSDSAISYSGIKKSGKRIGTWERKDCKRSEEIQHDYYDTSGTLFKSLRIRNQITIEETDFLNSGDSRLHIEYYDQGQLKILGFIHQSQKFSTFCGDGNWFYYDSLGNLSRKDFLDFDNQNVHYTFYNNSGDFVIREENYFVGNPEGEFIPDGKWIYSRNGSVDSVAIFDKGIKKK